jgi:DNA-binding CsgD family transcriptional regulator
MGELVARALACARRPAETIVVGALSEGDSLTRRELDVLARVAIGESTAQISRRLGIAENTIKKHLTSAYRKTGSGNRVQAARYYLERHGDPLART